jgi:hypothetical protein
MRGDVLDMGARQIVLACLDQETDEYPLRGLSNIRKLTYSIDPSVPWSEPL